MFTNFEEIQKLSKDQMEAATAAAASVTKGFQTIAAETSEQDFAKTTYEGFVAQATRVGELYANLAREAFRPIETAFSKAQSVAR